MKQHRSSQAEAASAAIQKPAKDDNWKTLKIDWDACWADWREVAMLESWKPKELSIQSSISLTDYLLINKEEAKKRFNNARILWQHQPNLQNDSNHQQVPKQLYRPLISNTGWPSFPRFHTIKFWEESRRSVNLYVILTKIAEGTIDEPKSATGNNWPLKWRIATKLIRKQITEIVGLPCSFPHSLFNYSKISYTCTSPI